MTEKPESVGELREALAKHDDSAPVRVNDDGRLQSVYLREQDGVVIL